jgi:predicted amidophosphoribosyltransferase
VCGESHSKESPAYLLADGTHLVKDTIRAGAYICEWCICWQCSRCGGFFRGQNCSARPSQWREAARFCGRCGGQKKHDADLRTLLEVGSITRKLVTILSQL